MPFPDEDQRHLTVAEGYAALKMYLDANAELEPISAEARHLPDVLEVRYAIYNGLEKWALAEIVAEKLVEHDPANPLWHVSPAYAAQYCRGLESAASILRVAVEHLPGDAMLQFNLACYECQLGEIAVARARLQTAFRIDPKLRLTALDEPDLEITRYRGGFDFVTLELHSGTKGFPNDYGGVSGSGMWILPTRCAREGGRELWSCDAPILGGVAYYQSESNEG